MFHLDRLAKAEVVMSLFEGVKVDVLVVLDKSLGFRGKLRQRWQ